MPRPEWSFFLPAEDHMRLKWMMSFAQAKFTIWGQIIFTLVFLGMAISSVGTQISAYFFVSLVWSLFFASLLFSFFFIPKVSARRSSMPYPTAGGIYTYRVTVTNIGRYPIRNLSLFPHQLPYGLYEHTVLEQPHMVDWLEPGKDTVFTLHLRIPRRGSYTLEPLIAGTSFPSGMMRSLRRVAGRASLLVLPKIIHLPDLNLPLHIPSLQQGSDIHATSGGTNEFLSTREYRDGDRLRDIHWNSSARLGRLIVKEYIHENALNIGIFIDTELKRFDKHASFETSISMAAGIADDLYQKKYALQLFLNNGTKFRQRYHSLAYFLEALATIEGGDDVNFTAALQHIQEEQQELSYLIVFLKDWDKSRQQFVNQLMQSNIPLKIIIVQDKPLTLPVEPSQIKVYTPKQFAS